MRGSEREYDSGKGKQSGKRGRLVKREGERRRGKILKGEENIGMGKS